MTFISTIATTSKSLKSNESRPLIIDPEFRSLIPEIRPDEQERLESSLRRYGCRDAIVVWNDTIVDGHQRYDICTRFGIPYEITRMTFSDRQEALIWIIDNQLSRRNLDSIDRILLAEKQVSFLAELARRRQQQGGRLKGRMKDPAEDGNDASDNIVESSQPIDVRKEVASIAGVSEGLVGKVRKIQAEKPELIENIRRGDLSISGAYEQTRDLFVTHYTGDIEWYTPKCYIDKARRTMGSIDCDPASNHTAQKWIKAKVYYTKDSNGLDKNWYGNIWMNAPYERGLIQKFTAKFLEEWHAGHVKQAVILVNNATETQWFQNLMSEATAVCFHKGRLRFLKGDQPQGAAMQGQAFIFFGEQHLDEFIKEFGTVGMIFTPVRSV